MTINPAGKLMIRDADAIHTQNFSALHASFTKRLKKHRDVKPGSAPAPALSAGPPIQAHKVSTSHSELYVYYRNHLFNRQHLPITMISSSPTAQAESRGYRSRSFCRRLTLNTVRLPVEAVCLNIQRRPRRPNPGPDRRHRSRPLALFLRLLFLFPLLRSLSSLVIDPDHP
ncbi:hypothetical protein OG21DRAFT_1490785 [Imleria badia]|nr:hypothetical protein OG21DRAFT_1490785 [Imleria badia]